MDSLAPILRHHPQIADVRIAGQPRSERPDYAFAVRFFDEISQNDDVLPDEPGIVDFFSRLKALAAFGRPYYTYTPS